jgi:hypothetical protein
MFDEGGRERFTSSLSSPTGVSFPAYLARLEQLLAVRCAGMNDGGPSALLSGEREIINGNLQLCVACPDNLGVGVLLGKTMLAMKKLRPDLAGGIKEKITLLQQTRPLPEPVQAAVKAIFDEVFAL